LGLDRVIARRPAIDPTLNHLLRPGLSCLMKAEGLIMLPWKPWLDAMIFGYEVQSVIALRLLKIATGGAGSDVESTRMVTEKVKALAEAQTAGAVALAQGKSVKAAKRAMTPIKRSVRANHRRLTKKK
jgi:hypothetical protein